MDTETFKNNSFDVSFNFENIQESEMELLNSTFILLKDNIVKFELKIVSENKVQPLDTLIKLKSSKTRGECILKMKKYEEELVDIIIKGFKVVEIIGLLDFNFENDDEKTVEVKFESDSIVYKTKDSEETITP